MQRTAANCKTNKKKKIKTPTVVRCVGHLGKFSVPSIWVFPTLYLSKWRLSRTSSDRRDVPVCQAFTAPAAAAAAAATDHNYVTSAGKCKQITQMYLTHTPLNAHRPLVCRLHVELLLQRKQCHAIKTSLISHNTAVMQ